MATLIRRLVTFAFLGALFAAYGCDYFRPTPPKPPGPGEEVIGDYTSPGATLQTFADAIVAKGTAPSAYRGVFADSTEPSTGPAYRHVFDPVDVVEYPFPVPNWTLSDETAFYASFAIYRPDSYTVVLEADADNPDVIEASTAEIHRHYRITAGTVVIAVGFADLQLVRGLDARWRIAVWEDRRDPLADPGQEERTLGWRRLNSGGT